MADSKHLLALTACPSGVAHTYMAAEKLAEAAASKGYTMDVETHGSIGVEGTFSPESIARADAVIVAADKDIDLARFAGKPIVVTKVSEGINHAGDLIDRALAAKPLEGIAPAEADASSGGGFGQSVYKALMNGVSHMIPFVVAGGLLLALATSLGGHSTTQGMVIPEGSPWYIVNQIGVLAFSLMVPVLSGYIAQAIADRPGLAPGLITGLIAMTPALYHSEAAAGFLGGIVTGFLSGYVALAIKKIKVHKWIAPIWPIIVIPVLTTAIVGMGFVYLLGSPIAAFFTWLTGVLSGMQGTQVVLLGLLLGAMIGFDMGGPVNKVAFLFAGGLISTGATVPMGMVAVAIATPPIGLGIASMVRRRLFTTEERNNGIAAVFMGFFGVTEGAIPFAAAHPLQIIPANVIGAAVGAATAGLFGVSNDVMWGGGIVAVLGAVGRPVQFFLALTVGAAANAVVAIALMSIGKGRDKSSEQSARSPEKKVVDDLLVTTEAAGITEPVVAQAPSFVDYLKPESIILDASFRSKEDAIRSLAERGLHTGQIADVEGVVATALAREELGTTAVGNALAIPHSKSDAADIPFLGFARCPEGMGWGAADGEPVTMIFLIAVPEAAAGNEHLKILAALARTLMHQEVRDELTALTSPDEVAEVLGGQVDLTTAS